MLLLRKWRECWWGWKGLYLSKAVRLMLIKSMLSNLPTYFLSLFPIPIGVINQIEKLHRKFLWGVAWIMSLNSILLIGRRFRLLHLGGLGILSFLTFYPLLGKCLWRYAVWKERLFGDTWWIKDVVVWWVIGALILSWGHMG